MAEPRYLIGQGEKLSEEIGRAPRGMGEKSNPYSFSTARKRLTSEFEAVAEDIDELPELAQPGGDAVIEITLHPSYLAKTYYPKSLIDDLGLYHLGSRAIHIAPEKVVGKRAEASGLLQPAPVLYLAGHARMIVEFSRSVTSWQPDDDVADAFRRIEAVQTPGKDRLKRLSNRFADRDELPLEVVLHNPDENGNSIVIGTFAEYLETLGARPYLNRRRQTGGLTFMPVLIPRDKLDDVLKFSFLRALREAPRIVPFDPVFRANRNLICVDLPDSDAEAPDLSVAIFDGGMPPDHGLERWVTCHDAPGVGRATQEGMDHGLAVTSAFLFGPLQEDVIPPPPFANVDHWRIFGENDEDNDFEAFDILDRIEDVLASRHYDFVNLSLGPKYAIDDDDVSPWTSTLDQLLSAGDTVATVACGNNGKLDALLGLNRVQPPSDGVNMLGVGASGSFNVGWKRAPYSACGPGRSPGYVKPDILCFGGSSASPMLVLSKSDPFEALGVKGTSFAAPVALRSGVGVRAQFTEALWAPAVKALLIHHANPSDHDSTQVGWGLVSHAVNDLVLCGDYEAHILYQRLMPTTGAVRLYLPVPPGLTGMVEIRATFAFYCEVDPEDAINYTRAGLDIQFRPNTTIIPPPYTKDGRLITPTVPASDSFFQAKDYYATEHMRRDDAQKWETALSRVKSKRSSSLNQPAFDVSYIAREHGHNGRRTANLKLALALTIRNKSAKDLYDRVIANSGNRLQPLRPRSTVSVPVRL